MIRKLGEDRDAPPSLIEVAETLETGTDELVLNVPEPLRPVTMRTLGLTPDFDRRVDALDLPGRSWLARLAIKLLRTYRRFRPRALGNRCVFEPSCSRYSELAFRKYGVLHALGLTLGRLRRCRPGTGGIDLKGLGECDEISGGAHRSGI